MQRAKIELQAASAVRRIWFWTIWGGRCLEWRFVSCALCRLGCFPSL